ncbi:MAG: flagellar protein export ATPase FliI [Calditrichaeota bacterium]|nr:flagellar protein export ATPase FliI [Calditrichota bacterium]
MPIPLPDIDSWFTEWTSLVQKAPNLRRVGRVQQVIGLVIESLGPAVSVGDRCLISNRRNGDILAEVVGFRGNRVLLMPIGEMDGIAPGSEVVASGDPFTVGVGESLLGRVLGGLGAPIDAKGALGALNQRPITARPPHPLTRRPIREPLATGARAIDALLTCGKGQRFGIFAGSGVGKSVLMGMIARYTSADVNVIALIGERGREVREFIDKSLGAEGLKHSVVVAVTSDQPALMRIKGGMTATTIAEYFRDQGADVMFMMDSVTRLAMAQREVGLAIGEPPTSRGYTPSLFALLPRLLERAGASDRGSITGLYTVLVEGDDMNEPVSDAVRSILDGHFVLSRKLAHQGLWPAIDPLHSVSRVMPDVTSREHQQAAAKLKRLLAAYREAEDLINIGAYESGSNPDVDEALQLMPDIKAFLGQTIDDRGEFEPTVERLIELTGENVGDQ